MFLVLSDYMRQYSTSAYISRWSTHYTILNVMVNRMHILITAETIDSVQVTLTSVSKPDLADIEQEVQDAGDLFVK